MSNKENKGINALDNKDLIKKASRYNGVECPSCKRKIKAYKRTITPTMAIALIEMLKFYRYKEGVTLGEYYTKEEFFTYLEPEMYVDYTLLYNWDLIEPQGNHPVKFIKKRGYWRITDNGIKFALMEVAVPKFAIIYNGEVSEHITTPPLMIDEVLKNAGLDYYELIKLKKEVTL